MIRSFILYAVVCLPGLVAAQTSPKFLYLENTSSGKVKKLNLDRVYYLSYEIDSLGSDYSYNKSYTSYNPENTVFGEKEVVFSYSEYYESYSEETKRFDLYNEKGKYYTSDTVARLPYESANDVEIYLTYQTRFRSALFGISTTLACSALFNAVIVAPLIGLNNGSFQGYNFKRLGRGELYSGITLGVSIPMMVIFSFRDYYLQSSYGFKTWRVVNSK